MSSLTPSAGMKFTAIFSSLRKAVRSGTSSSRASPVEPSALVRGRIFLTSGRSKLMVISPSRSASARRMYSVRSVPA
jgi:hypothetical protein